MKTRFWQILLAVIVTVAVLPVSAHAQSPLQVMQTIRASYSTPMPPSEAVPFLTQAAKAVGYVTGRPFGLLVKTAGNNCGGYACDVICDGMQVFDVLIDGPDARANLPGQATPTFNPNPNDPVGTRTCKLLAPEPPSQPPTPPQPPQPPQPPTPPQPPAPSIDLSPVIARLNDLQTTQAAQTADIAAIRQDVAEIKSKANEVWKFVGKYVAPAIGAFIAGWQLK